MSSRSALTINFANILFVLLRLLEGFLYNEWSRSGNKSNLKLETQSPIIVTGCG